MTPLKALVIETCPRTLERIEDALVALQHERDIASSLVEARRLVDAYTYDYVLTSIAIPASYRGGPPSVANVENFLEYYGAVTGDQLPPVIVMSDRTGATAELTVDLMRLAMALGRRGAMDVIAMPFPVAGRPPSRRPWRPRPGTVRPTTDRASGVRFAQSFCARSSEASVSVVAPMGATRWSFRGVRPRRRNYRSV